MVSKPSYRARLATYLIPIGLFLGVATVALLLARGYSFDLQTGLQKTGLVVLDSSPKGAFITINNRVQAAKTRTTLKLAPGSYDLKIDMPGVHPWQKPVRVEPGEAALEENILLFLSSPKRTELTAGAVPAQALAPSAKELAFLNPTPSGVTLSVAPVNRHDAPRALSELPAGFAAPRSFDWSPDGNRIVTSAGGETRITAVGDGRTVAVPVGGRAALAPGQTERVVVEPEPGRLVQASAGGQTPEPYETDVTAWTVTRNAVFASHTDGTLVRHDAGGDRRVIAHGHVLTELTTTAENDRVFGRDAAGTLYMLDGTDLRTIATDTGPYAVSRDGDQVAYLRQRELRLWDRTDRTDVLLTRFTAPPERLAVIPGGHYVLYGRSGELHAIASDGSNDTQLATGMDLVEIINRESVLIRDRMSGRTTALTILNP